MLFVLDDYVEIDIKSIFNPTNQIHYETNQTFMYDACSIFRNNER